MLVKILKLITNCLGFSAFVIEAFDVFLCQFSFYVEYFLKRNPCGIKEAIVSIVTYLTAK